MSDFLRPHGLYPIRLLCPWGFSRQGLLEWVAMPSSRGSSRPRDLTSVSHISCIGRQVLYHWTHQMIKYSSTILRKRRQEKRYSTFRIKSKYKRLLEKAMAPHSSTLAWKIPWTEEPGWLQSMGSLRVGHD